MASYQDPFGFFEGVKKLAEAVKQARAMNQVKRDQWRADMYTHRWKYFFTIPFFLGVCVFFLWLGVIFKEEFYNIIGWYVWMGLASIFLLLGVYTWFSYLWIILKGKKE